MATVQTDSIDIIAELKKDIESEGADNQKYLSLAMAADEKYPCRGYGSILRAIAKDEETHHRYIKMILDDMHVPPDMPVEKPEVVDE